MRATGYCISGEPGVPARPPHCMGETSVAPPYDLVPGKPNESLAVRPPQPKSRRVSRTQTLRTRKSQAESQYQRALARPANTQLRADGDGARSTPSGTCKTT